MNTVYGILAALAIMACLAGWGSWEAARVDKVQAQLDSRIAAEQTAAAQAKLDAQKETQAALANLQSQSAKAIQDATNAKNQAQLTAATYSQKLAQLAGKPKLDIGHQCALTPVPSELLP